jgi:hypothetical protein
MTEENHTKWVLHVQLASLEQDERAMDLLQFPTEPLLPNQFDLRVTRCSRGRQIQSRRRTKKSLAELSNQKSNKIRAIYTTKPATIPDPELVITKITNILHLSPTNSLWESASGYEAEGRLDKKRRRSLEGLERGLRWSGLSTYPTLLESFIELESDAEPNTILSVFFERLALSFPPDLLKTRIVGCADFVRYIPLNMLEVLAPWPDAYKYLVDRFDDLHPILIGASSLAQGFAGLSLNNVEIKPVLSENGSSVMTLLRIPETTLRDRTSVVLASGFLVPKDETTTNRHEWSAALGEHTIGGNPMFTWRRTWELIEQGLLPTPEPGTVVRHFIHPKYCQMLGIDPADSL